MRIRLGVVSRDLSLRPWGPDSGGSPVEGPQKAVDKTMRIAAFLVLRLPLGAQIDNGNITGLVTDSSGAAIVNAQVTVTPTEMNSKIATTTNEEGISRALNLRPGHYRITFVAPK